MIKVLFTMLFPNETMMRLMEGKVWVGWCLVMIDDRKEGKVVARALSIGVEQWISNSHVWDVASPSVRPSPQSLPPQSNLHASLHSIFPDAPITHFVDLWTH
jgi:hypothetical protein